MRPTRSNGGVILRGLLLAALGAIGLAGCGNSSLSSAQLRIQADRMCSLANQRTARIPTPATPADTVAFLRRGIGVMRPELVALRSLHPPKDAGDVYSASLTAFSKKLGAMRTTMREISFGHDPVVAIKALQRELAPLEAQEDGGWQALDVSACLNR